MSPTCPTCGLPMSCPHPRKDGSPDLRYKSNYYRCPRCDGRRTLIALAVLLFGSVFLFFGCCVLIPAIAHLGKPTARQSPNYAKGPNSILPDPANTPETARR